MARDPGDDPERREICDRLSMIDDHSGCGFRRYLKTWVRAQAIVEEYCSSMALPTGIPG